MSICNPSEPGLHSSSFGQTRASAWKSFKTVWAPGMWDNATVMKSLLTKWQLHSLTHNRWLLFSFTLSRSRGNRRTFSVLSPWHFPVDTFQVHEVFQHRQAIVYNSTSCLFVYFLTWSISLWYTYCTIKAKENFDINLNMIVVVAASLGPPADISHRLSWLKQGPFPSPLETFSQNRCLCLQLAEDRANAPSSGLCHQKMSLLLSEVAA